MHEVFDILLLPLAGMLQQPLNAFERTRLTAAQDSFLCKALLWCETEIQTNDPCRSAARQTAKTVGERCNHHGQSTFLSALHLFVTNR